MSLVPLAENYFNHLNPLAEKISFDIAAIREAYEDLWHTLSIQEKEQIIDETVIHPEVVLKYALRSPTERIQEDKDGENKYIYEETTGVYWRDEHSAPFYWKTPSQQNLHLFTETEEVTKHISDKRFDPEKKPVVDNKCVNVPKNKNFQEELEKFLKNGLKFDKVSNNTTKGDTPDSPHLVLGGNAAKKQVQKLEGKNLISFSNFTASVNHQNLLMKIKANTVNKIQSSIKAVGVKSISTTEKNNYINEHETENLVQKNSITITRVPKVSPKNISKPKSPPPPPPPLKNDQIRKKDQQKKIVRENKRNTEDLKTDTEMISLLQDCSHRNSKTDQEEIIFFKESAKKDLSMEADSSTSESVGLSSQSTKESELNLSQSNSFISSSIPKSGFDFLDNW